MSVEENTTEGVIETPSIYEHRIQQYVDSHRQLQMRHTRLVTEVRQIENQLTATEARIEESQYWKRVMETRATLNGHTATQSGYAEVTKE